MKAMLIFFINAGILRQFYWRLEASICWLTHSPAVQFRLNKVGRCLKPPVDRGVSGIALPSRLDDDNLIGSQSEVDLREMCPSKVATLQRTNLPKLCRYWQLACCGQMHTALHHSAPQRSAYPFLCCICEPFANDNCDWINCERPVKLIREIRTIDCGRC
jgi:hypothetical protein